MKVSELKEKLAAELLTDPNFEDRAITGCYIGDLLSRVMGMARPGDCWITIMNNVNIVAVASLTEAACIILCEDVSVDEATLKKADGEGIVILKSSASAYELACKIRDVI